jgi:hypothetical protein
MKYQFGLQILVLVMAFSFGCMKVKKKDDVAPKTETAVSENDYRVSSLTSSNLIMRYQGQPKPNQYTAEISWPHTTIKSTYRIIQANSEIREFTENSIALENLVGGQESKVTFEQYSIVDQKRLTSFDVFLAPPKDFVFDGVILLQQNVEENVERLFFTSSAKVYTNQFNLKIRAKNIYSEFGAVISNFPEGSVAAKETVGLSGGKTEIDADVAEGNLQVIMNAQQGGEGKYGWPMGTYAQIMNSPMIFPKDLKSGITGDDIPACPGSDGAHSGSMGNFFLKFSTSSNLLISTRMLLVPGGNYGVLNEKCFYNYPQSMSCVPTQYSSGVASCDYKRIPHNGRPAAPGQICTKMSSSENFKCEKF